MKVSNSNLSLFKKERNNSSYIEELIKRKEKKAYKMMDLIVSPEYTRLQVEAMYNTSLSKLKQEIIELEDELEKIN